MTLNRRSLLRTMAATGIAAQATTELATASGVNSANDHLPISPLSTDGDSIYVVLGTNLLCLANEKPQWETKLDGTTRQKPLVGQDSIFASTHHYIYCVSKDSGVIKWKSKLPKTGPTSGSILDKSIIVGCGGVPQEGGCILRYSIEDGEEIWQHEVSSMLNSTPAVDMNGVLFVTSSGEFVRLDNEGQRVWKTSSGSSSSKPLLDDNNAYILSRDGHLRAFRKDIGRKLWQTQISDPVNSNGCLVNDRIVSPGRDYVSIITKRGKLLNKFEVDANITGASYEDPWVVYGTKIGRVGLINTQNNKSFSNEPEINATDDDRVLDGTVGAPIFHSGEIKAAFESGEIVSVEGAGNT